MGLALADAAAGMGALVTLVLGPVSLRPFNESVRIVDVVTARDMADHCINLFPDCEIAILAASVADFTPVETADKKIKRTDQDLILKLRPTVDIAARLGTLKKPGQLLVGFALETENGVESAIGKMIRKNLDLVVLNSMKDTGAGFGFDTNKITLIDKNNIIDKFELKSKVDAAEDILGKIISML